MVLAAAACGGKAVIDAPIGAGGAGGQTTATTGSSANPFTVVVSAASGTEPVCASIEASYAAALEKAKTCTPGVADPCTKVVPSDLRNCCTPNVAIRENFIPFNVNVADLDLRALVHLEDDFHGGGRNLAQIRLYGCILPTALGQVLFQDDGRALDFVGIVLRFDREANAALFKAIQDL